MSRKRFALLLAAVLLGSFGFHAYRAENPTTRYQSADERSYGRLALSIADDHEYGTPRMRDPLHWPPGAPVLFAAAHELFPSAGSYERRDIPAAYWALAIVSTLTALLAALVARVLAGPWAGLLAGALVGFYPPLILATGEQLSEPFGALWVTAGVLALALARRSGRAWWYAGCGILFGFAVLTRADLLPAVALLPVLMAAWDRRLLGPAAIAAGAALAIAPWSVYASRMADEFVPVTRGSASALFVGTYLPGGGTMIGMKRDLAEEVWKRNPELAPTVRPGQEPAPAREGSGTSGEVAPTRSLWAATGGLDPQVVLEVVAARHPDLDFNAAIAAEARKNLVRYGLGDPLRFGQMMLDKGVSRMWARYSRGGARPTSSVITIWHMGLVIVGFAGLLCGVRARRDGTLAAVLLLAFVGTAVHAIFVSQARYNLPLMPVVIAGGVAGMTLALRRIRAAEKPADRVAEPELRPGAVPAGIPH